MNEIGLNELLQLIIRDKGGTPQQYNQLMDYIAFHETGPTQRYDPSAKQEKGPGRGLFQFEVGKEKGGNLAVNRTVNYLERSNKVVPQWLRELWTDKKSVDVSGLSADKQKMLFLGYHRENASSNFSNIWSGKQSIQDFWLKNHWAGNEGAVEKLDLFNKSMVAKDSIDARNIREAELFPLQDKVPFQSAENDINNLPNVSDILKGIFGQQKSSLVKEYDHGGKHFDFSKTTDYSGENLKDDWLWKNISQPFVKATTWLGEGMVPSSFEHLLAMTGGGAAISGIAKQAPKLGRYLSKKIKEGVRQGKMEWGNPTIDAASIGKNRVSAFQDVINKEKKYLLSDEYMTKRMANTGESKSQVTKELNKYLRELKQTNISQAPIESNTPGWVTQGTYSPQKITLNKNIDDVDELLGTLKHETKHLLSPIGKSSNNPYPDLLWKDIKTGKVLTESQAAKATKDIDFVQNPKWLAWESKHGSPYKNYPKIEIDPKHSQHKYLMLPHEQQVRMVEYGNILKKYGWDGTAKGLTNDIIDASRSYGRGEIPFDVQQLLSNMKGAKIGSKKWYTQIKKTLPYAWGMAPVAATTLNKEYDDGGTYYGGMLPEVEVSALTDESYNKLSQPQQQVYDTFVGPTGTAQTVGIGGDREMHWKNALQMTEDLGIRNIYNKNSWLFQKLFERYPDSTSKESRITPHANAIMRNVTIPEHRGPGHPDYNKFSQDVIDDLKENKEYWVKQLSKEEREAKIKEIEISHENYARKDYFDNLIAEYAHIPEFWRTESFKNLPVSIARDIYRFITLQELDHSRYEDPYHYEYHTHSGHDSFEEKLKDKYKIKK